jgi:hypothetical protein
MELVITLALLGLAVASAGALFVIARVPDRVCCWHCGKELDYEDEWHVDLTRLPGKVLCRWCWENKGGERC